MRRAVQRCHQKKVCLFPWPSEQLSLLACGAVTCWELYQQHPSNKEDESENGPEMNGGWKGNHWEIKDGGNALAPEIPSRKIHTKFIRLSARSIDSHLGVQESEEHMIGCCLSSPLEDFSQELILFQTKVNISCKNVFISRTKTKEHVSS